MTNKLNTNGEEMAEFAAELETVQNNLPHRINADPAGPDTGLAKLVLTLIELIRRLLEQQALRRMENGTLSDAEIERIGTTFIQLEKKMAELKEVFKLEDEDLNLDLGPLGNLM